MIKAQHWEKIDDNTVQCNLCPHHCKIKENNAGICRIRKNLQGILYSMNYGKITAANIDPIEKKPLYHFYPNSSVLSLGTYGCNFHCQFCQNWQIAHGNPQTRKADAEDIVELAVREHRKHNSIGIAYTYSEPMVWFEYIKDIAPGIIENNLKNILVTNGFIEEKPLSEILPYISAMNIDVKGFTSKFYKNTVKGEYLPVLKTAEKAKKSNCHIEITTLLIPGLNDSTEEIENLTKWICNSLGKDTPLHFSRYFPNYKLDIEPTPVETLEKAREIALKRLEYVYIGNVSNDLWRNTYCPNCGELIIRRTGYCTDVINLNIEEKRCAKCGNHINVIM